MDLTQGTFEEKKARSKKMMLWFGMISMTMTFAAWTSAWMVSKSRKDWLDDFQLPKAFWVSTVIIIVSSIVFHLAKKAIKNNNRKLTTQLVWVTLALGIAFIVTQFVGFGQIIDAGYYFTGPQSSVTASFLYMITAVHIVHVIAGLIVLLVVIYKHAKGRYDDGQTLGFELGVMFWHFLDVIWVLLFLFFLFL